MKTLNSLKTSGYIVITILLLFILSIFAAGIYTIGWKKDRLRALDLKKSTNRTQYIDTLHVTVYDTVKIVKYEYVKSSNINQTETTLESEDAINNITSN